MCMWGVSSTSFKVTMDMQALYRHWIGEFYEVVPILKMKGISNFTWENLRVGYVINCAVISTVSMSTCGRTWN